MPTAASAVDMEKKLKNQPVLINPCANWSKEIAPWMLNCSSWETTTV
jgi:hypothetical protein